MLIANNQLKQEVKLLKKQNHQLRIKQYNRLSSDTSSSGSESSSDDDPIDGTTTTTTRPHHSRDGLSEQHSLSSSDESRMSGTSGTCPVTNSKTSSSQVRNSYKDSTSLRQASNLSKSKITILGSSMVRNTGPIISESFVDTDSTVYSVSGLSIKKAGEMAKQIFSDHSSKDTAVLQVGTCDVENHRVDELVPKYNQLIDSVSKAAPFSKIIVTAVPQPVSANSSQINDKTNKLNNKLRSICSKKKFLCFMDANPPLQQPYYREDGYHFNFMGTSYFARFIGNYISHSLNFLPLPIKTYP